VRENVTFVRVNRAHVAQCSTANRGSSFLIGASNKTALAETRPTL
jgi:hypothetical protein